jgi:pimeloyl-ACP methyl ester carboxylesterase
MDRRLARRKGRGITAGAETLRAREQTRARCPDEEGFVERDGVRVYFEVYGHGDPTVLFLPTWTIIHSRHWKLQLPYFARHARAITFDPRGNGRSDRPTDPRAYAEAEFAADALAVLDATATERAVIVSLSLGAHRALLLAAEHPERVAGAVFIGPALPLAGLAGNRAILDRFDEELETDEGWAKYNRHYWLRDYEGFLQFFFSQCFSEPHSTKQIEDCVRWGLDTTPETLLASEDGAGLASREAVLEICERVGCPVLVIHGKEDRIRPVAHGAELARLTRGTFVAFEGGGHLPHARDPVRVNLLIRRFVESVP